MLWTIKFAHKHHFYMMYDLVMQFILPFMLVVSLMAMIEQTILYQNFGHLYQYLIALVLIAISVHCMVFIELKILDFYSLLSMALCTCYFYYLLDSMHY